MATKTIKSAADIRIFLASELPCYSLDGDSDDFVFIAQGNDIGRVALELWRSLAARPLDSAGRCAFYQGVGDEDCWTCKHAPGNQPQEK